MVSERNDESLNRRIMKYYSTRDKSKNAPFSLKDAAFAGLAPDGGLFVPEYIPQVDMAEVERLADVS